MAAELYIDNNQIQKLSLPINVGRAGTQFIVYTPALDLSTNGDSEEQAFANFRDAVFIFLEDLIEQGTLEEVLNELGWEFEDCEWTPPAWQCGQTIEVCAPVM